MSYNQIQILVQGQEAIHEDLVGIILVLVCILAVLVVATSILIRRLS